MSNLSANRAGCNNWLKSLYQGDTSFYYSILASRYSREFTAVHEISNCSAVKFRVSIPSKAGIYVLSCKMWKALIEAQEIDQLITSGKSDTFIRLKNERFVICRSYISSRKDHTFRENIYEDTQAIAHEASIKGWTRLLNDQWALIISNAVCEYFLMAIFNTLIDEKKNRILVGRVLDRNLERSLFCLSRS